MQSAEMMRVVRMMIPMVFLLFACTSDSTTSDAGTGDKNDIGSRSSVGDADGSEETSGVGGADNSVEAGAGGADGSAGQVTGDSGGLTGGDSAVVPSVDAGDSESTSVDQADSHTGDETWTGPYANVVAVSANGAPGSYTFSVSIESSDIDCSQYASWWEVLTEDGALIFRRILEHSHTDDNGTTDPNAPGNTFTRSGGPIDIGADEVVIVRAHMNTGGYHGAVMWGSVASDFTTATDIDAQFAAGVEFEEPQPTGCRF